MILELPLAHGLGGVRDLPVPLWLFYYGAAIVLVVSFIALGALWRRPLLEARREGRPLPAWLQRVVLAPALRAVLGAVSVFLLALVFLAALLGEDSPATNLAPTFVYVLFWLGLVPVVVLLGNVWPALSPWRAVADATAWLADRAGAAWTAPFRYPEGLGRWPAASLLLAFATLELAYPHAASPRTLAVAIALYSWVTWLGILAFGRKAWLDNGEAFTVYFALLARLSPFTVREASGGREVVARTPLSGLAGRDDHPGALPFVAVMLGSVGFDGFSRTSWWQDRAFDVESEFLAEPRVADLAVTLFNLGGLVATVLAVALLYLLAVEAARVAAGVRRSLASDFVGSLVPIALAYAVAHYFSLFVIQAQQAGRLFSDPFGFGWDVLGLAGEEGRLDVLSPNTVWYVQVAALVTGHVLGLALAHDRAVALVRARGLALRTQYALLLLMVAYTVGGLWLLASG